ncbi:MAG: hypothetical protein ACRD0I_01080 [Acidimicrobiales bacterium]
MATAPRAVWGPTSVCSDGTPDARWGHADQGGAITRAVRVLVDAGGTDKEFDYSVPDVLMDQVGLGTMVRVALGPRRVGGWVVDVNPQPVEGVVLRPLARVRGQGPDPQMIDLARWAAWRWSGSVAGFLATASPTKVIAAVPGRNRDRGDRDLDPAGLERDGEEEGEGRRTVVRLAPAADRMPIVRQTLAEARALDGDALVLCASHYDAATLAARLERAGAAVALMPQAWALAAAGGCTVIGTRSAAWAPLERLGAALVLDAHDQAYTEQRAPTWNAWAVVAERARRAEVSCTLVSACPTLEMTDWGTVLRPDRVAERAGWPTVEVVDRRADDPRQGMFSERVVGLIRAARPTAGRRVLCVLNRTGRARLVACASCGELARCEQCQSALSTPPGTRGQGMSLGPTLCCRRCGAERGAFCATCGSTRLAVIRAGVGRVKEEIEALIGGPVVEVSGPRRRAAQSQEPNHAGELWSGGGDQSPLAVAIGTEAVLHRSVRGEIGSVIFLDFDQQVLAPRLRAGEEAMALLCRAARLVGSRSGSGRLVIQTRMPDHEVVLAARWSNPELFSLPETLRRQTLGLPPFCALARISGTGAQRLVDQLESAGLGVAQIGESAVSVRGSAQLAWLIRAGDHLALCTALASLPRPQQGVRIEVDPLGV